MKNHSGLKTKSLFKQYGQFFTGVLVFRSLDWALYAFVVQTFDVHFLAMQLLNVALFAFLKYEYSRWVMER